MTEDEAKTKWCFMAVEPMVTGPTEHGHQIMNNMSAVNRTVPFGQVPAGCTCLGSACMAWLWKTSGDGFCGLVGK